MIPSSLRTALPLLLLALIVLAVAGSAVADRDAVDTVLGAVAGASSVFLLASAFLLRADRRARRTDDLAALDRLEPLRAARRDDT